MKVHGKRGRQCCVTVGGEGAGRGHFAAQIAPMSGFRAVAVEHIDATRDGYDCYWRLISSVERLQLHRTKLLLSK